MKHCTYCGKEYPDDVEVCQTDGEALQAVGAPSPAPQPSVMQSSWNKDLSGYIWPWLEPLLGAFLVYAGIKAIVTQEYRYRMWIYHGVTAEFAGALMLLGAFLLFRGRVWRKRGWSNWTILDKIVGGIVGVGILFFIVMRWVSILR
jgi:hypothetical protein